MWAVAPFTHRPFLSPIPASRPTKPPVLFTVLATSPPYRRRSSSKPKQNQQKTEEEELGREKQPGPTRTKQLSGLDVLWAMQRAASEKARGNRAADEKTKSKEFSAGMSDEEEADDSDCSNVRPLSIKKDWGVRLEVLEMRLEELSATK